MRKAHSTGAIHNKRTPPRRAGTLVAAAGWAWAALAATVGVSAPSESASSNWQDVESRIQYGYYTEDVRALMGVAELLRSGDGEDAMKSYYEGLVSYRLTQLQWTASDKSTVKKTSQQCVASLAHALGSRSDFADGLALQAACLEQMAALQSWRKPFASSKSGAQIRRAQWLAPKNPRVRLLDAVEDYEHSMVTAADRDRVLGKLEQAVAAFEAERQGEIRVPGWGAAEAYVYLARCQLDRGDALAARDALEHALLIAPEYAEARRMMAKITSG